MVVFDTIFSTVNQHGCSYAYVYLTFLGTSSEELSDAPVWQCMAMPAGNEAEDLGGPLSRLLGLVSTPFCTVLFPAPFLSLTTKLTLRIAAYESLSLSMISLIQQIQDVCTVESGPHLDSKHAYVIVRHVKFATKKGGKKASKAMEDASKGSPRTATSESPPAATDSGDDTSEHVHGVKNWHKQHSSRP